MFCFWQQRCHENPEDEEAVAELYALENVQTNSVEDEGETAYTFNEPWN